MDHLLRSSAAVERPDTDLSAVAEQEAFCLLLTEAYRNHRSAVFGAASRLCGSAMAEEVTQEVFVQLWLHPDRFDPTKGTLRTFLMVITRHRAIDVLRSDVSRRDRERRDGLTTPAVVDDVDADILRRERAIGVAEALHALPQKELEAIELTFYGECTYREAAMLLGEAEGTIKSRIRSGLHRLACHLADSERDRHLGAASASRPASRAA